MSEVNLNLLNNVHNNLVNPTESGETHLVNGIYQYYHYNCDDFKDQGWGCGYRTLQTLCSWVRSTRRSTVAVPSIPEIQHVLVEMEDKPLAFLGSKDWIGSFEVCLVIDKLYDVPSKIMHVQNGTDLNKYLVPLIEHFNKFGSPIMMGGDRDCSSKGIMGVHISGSEAYLLIVDPHFTGKPNIKQLQNDLWVKWQNLSDFCDSSFYNFCLPQLSYTLEDK